ncbi:MAG: polyprenyl synthetase family protein [Desulfuromonadales bacterium]|nr:polyprenyl synthetase family protein [Desulfuromonadales bacterium]
MDLPAYLKRQTTRVDDALDRFLPDEERMPHLLHKAMRYSIFAGGKRIRPILLLAASEAVGGQSDRVLYAASALEMIHTYSLIHDDLPAMDNDDLRRGRPTSHKVFGEAHAILAGDALLTEAFALLTDPGDDFAVAPAVQLRVANIIARAAGAAGMVGGQIVDMESEGGGDELDLPTVEYIHTHKTGALIRAAVEVGAILGGADQRTFKALSRYGELAGLAFQIADDILDVVGDQDVVGKDIGSDEARGKATYVALFGLSEAQSRADELRDMALETLESLGEKAEPLRQIVNFIVARTS